MRRQAVVTALRGDTIEVVALFSSECITCASDCGRRGKPFRVTNRRRFPLAVGDVVKVYHSRFVRGLSGIIALFIPIACAVAAYCATPAIARRLHLPLTELVKASGVLAGILLPSAAIFAVNRSNLHIFKPEITQVL